MANRFWVGNGGTWDASDTTHWSATDGGAGGASVPGSGDAVTINANSGTGTITVNTNFTVTSIVCGAMNMTLDFATHNNSPTMATFNSSGAGTRIINMGTGTIWTLTGNAGSIWSTSTSTNLTLNVGTSTVVCTYSGGTGTRTITTGVMPLNNLAITAGTDIIVLSSQYFGNSIDFSGFTGSWTAANTASISGNLTLGTGMTVTSGTGTLTLNATSGTQVIRSNGVQMNRPVTVNAPGATIQLFDALDLTGASSRLFNLSTGTFDANNKTFSVSQFSSTTTNTRSILQGSAQWTISGNNTTVWNTNVTTGLSFTKGALPINFTYAGATGTRTIAPGGTGLFVDLASTPDFSITAGTDIVVITNAASSRMGNLNFTGFTGTQTPGVLTIYGSLIYGTGMTVSSSTNTLTMAPTTAVTITSNSVVVGNPIAIAGTSSVTLVDALTGLSTNTLTLTSGTFSTGNQAVGYGLFDSSNSNVRTLTLGSSVVTLNGSGTVWNTGTTTNLTFNKGTGNIILNESTAATKTFAGGALTFFQVTFDGTGTGTFIMGTSTVTTGVDTWVVTNPPHTIQVFAGKTINVGTLTWSGTAGNLNTFQSTTNGSQWFLNKASGTNTEDYISLQDSGAGGGATYNAGTHSTDAGDNYGWIFGTTPPAPGTGLGLNQRNVIANAIMI